MTREQAIKIVCDGVASKWSRLRAAEFVDTLVNLGVLRLDAGQKLESPK
jgi:hypothetical protein